MKTLYLLRHAKSSRDNFEFSDFDRSLNDRGYADAHLVSKHLSKKNIRFDVLISSPAIRAISTALIFAGNLDYPADKIQMRHKLYDSTIHHYLTCISEIGDRDSVLLVGHNETITETAQKLSVKSVNELKTCSIICFQFDINSWKIIFNSKGKLIFQVNPDSINEG